MSATLIRRFLIRQPRPSQLRITVGDEQQMMKLPAVPRWADVAESVDALGATLIEMLDDKGTLLRAFKSDQFDDDQEQELVTARMGTAKAALSDPETARFNLVAQLLADAYRFSTEVAFDKLVGLLEGMAKITETRQKEVEAMAKALRKSYEENADLTVEAETKKDPFVEIAQAFLGAKQQAEMEKFMAAQTAAAKPASKSNGKAKVAS